MKLFITFFFGVIVSNYSQAQVKASLMPDTIDTVTVRICKGDLPGQEKHLNVDTTPIVCAYIFKEGNLLQFKVIVYDFFYDNNGAIEKYHGMGCKLTPEMREIIKTQRNKKGTSKIFLDNIVLEDSVNGRFSLYGHKYIY